MQHMSIVIMVSHPIHFLLVMQMKNVVKNLTETVIYIFFSLQFRRFTNKCHQFYFIHLLTLNVHQSNSL